MLEIMNVSKRYGKVLAADGVSFNVSPGEISVLLGPNGAGKTTIIKCIAGLLRYGGGIRIKGFDNRSIDAKSISLTCRKPLPYMIPDGGRTC